jgi:choline dehydrogenase-like flavoprotein
MTPTLRAVSRAWSIVFALVGLGVLAAPEFVASFVARSASILGLGGEISPEPLLHALAVSLMACITVGAWSGRADLALLVAKATSTVIFLGLVARHGPAWLVPAGADGFVATTLLFARALDVPSPLVGRLMSSIGARQDPDSAAARASRLPRPIGAVWAITGHFIEWFGPLLVLGRFARASRLQDSAFDALQEGLLHRRGLIGRVAYIVLRAPTGGAGWPEPQPAKIPHPLSHAPRGRGERFDTIVIGSGAGGAPVAERLARAGRAVAVIERGTLIEPMTSDEAVERYYIEQAMMVTSQGAPVLAAHAVGGTTALNSGTCLRPLPERLADWDAALGTKFTSGLLDPWLEAAESALGVTVADESLLDAGARALRDGFERLGRDRGVVLPRNAPGCDGSAGCCFGCRTGAKQSTDRAFLPGAIDAGAQLFSSTRVLRLREDRDGVQVEVEDSNGRRVLRGGRVIVAAGAIGTPELLRRSGLGGPGVGRGLRLHPAAKVLARFPAPFEHGRGVPQLLGWRAAEFPRSTFEGMWVPPASLAQLLAVAGSRQRAWMDSASRHGSFGVMMHDRGEGRLGWIGGRPFPLYRLHPEDAADMIAGMRLVARAFLAAGAERVLLPVFGAPNEASSIDELNALDLRGARPSWASFHPQGTAGMGRVVSPELRLTERIDVCDASVFPSSPGANPQLTLVALSLRLAHRLGAPS